LFKEHPDSISKKFQIKRSEITGKDIQLCLVFQIFAGAGIAILPIMQTFLEEGAGYSDISIGIIFMLFSVGMFLGAVVFGLLGDRLTVKLTLVATTVFYAILIVFVIFLNLSVFETAAGFFLIVGIANGGYEATQMRISMDHSPQSISGTMYNLYNSLSNVGQLAIGAIVIAFFVELFGGNYQLGWQLGWVFLFIALVPGYYLVTKYRPIGAEDDSMIIPEAPRFTE
jgi:MFS family permease